MESPFDVLSVDPDADDEEIKEAYRERVKDAHPDHGGSAREFQLVRAAYDEIKGSDRDGETADESDETAGAEPERSESVESDERGERRTNRCRVEYVNYEILDDYGLDLDDPDLLDTVAEAGLDSEDYGQFWVRPRESLLEAAERHGFAWPFACRGGACANCAIILLKGEMRTRVDHVLPQEMLDKGFQLSCNGMPVTDELQVVYNVKSMPELEELLLPPRPFEQAHDD